MFFWIIFILTLILLTGNYKIGLKNYSRPFFFLSFIFITIITIIRFDIGYDYKSYWLMVSDLNISQEDFYYLEPFTRVVIGFSRLFDYPPLFFIIYGVLTVSMVYYCIWNYSKLPLVGVLIYCAFFYLMTLGFIRQGLALSIVLLSYPHIINGKIFKFLVMIILAGIVHYPALIALIIYPLYNYCSVKKLGFLLLLGFVGFQGGIILLQRIYPQFVYLHYLDSLQSLTGGNLVRQIFLILTLVMLFLSIKKHLATETKLILISFIGVFFYFALGGHIGGRIGWYFLIFLCISVPNIISYYPKVVRQVLNTSLCFIFISTIYVSTLSKDKEQFTPYRTILQIDVNHPRFK